MGPVSLGTMTQGSIFFWSSSIYFLDLQPIPYKDQKKMNPWSIYSPSLTSIYSPSWIFDPFQFRMSITRTTTVEQPCIALGMLRGPWPDQPPPGNIPRTPDSKMRGLMRHYLREINIVNSHNCQGVATQIFLDFFYPDPWVTSMFFKWVVQPASRKTQEDPRANKNQWDKDTKCLMFFVWKLLEITLIWSHGWLGFVCLSH